MLWLTFVAIIFSVGTSGQFTNNDVLGVHSNSTLQNLRELLRESWCSNRKLETASVLVSFIRF